MKKLKLLSGLVCILPTFTLQGCVTGAVVAGSAASAKVASDTRSVKIIADDVSADYHAHEALAADKALNAEAHIVAVSYNHIMLLVGQAPTEELRARAEDRVKNLEGIKRVVNKINVEPPIGLSQKSKDTVITTNVKARMLATTNLKSSQVKVITENGVVYLLGKVSREQGKIAAEVARDSTGVKKVVKVFEYTD
jgi:osmotically-inducible protein OsmY